MLDIRKPIANPLVVLREEFDDWAVLFDPDTGNAFGLNPVGVFVWKRLDGHHTPERIASEIRENCQNVPDEVEAHVEDLIQNLVKQGLVGEELER